MLADFEPTVVEINDTTIFTRRKGSGPPVLLLHGFPETHVMWHLVAPQLAEAFTVVCADLRGYGASGKPRSDAEHTPFSKRAMAADMIGVMRKLGFERFAIVGHDRGGRVAYRAALDHPQHVDRLAIFDIIPGSEALARADARLAFGFWPWSLLAQPPTLPERLIIAAPDAVVDDALTNWGSMPTSFPAQIRAAYIDALRDEATVHAICEEYRAAMTLDRTHDEADAAARRRITCPTLVLWAEQGALDVWYDDAGGPLAIWRRWAVDVGGHAIRGGHFFPEENPAETISELWKFLTPRVA
jgi:haloacetate dehalogenase